MNAVSRGFTLIELLVAMAIFAVVSALALGGLNAVATQQELAREDLTEFASLQRAMRDLTWDLAQLYPRPVRDELGQATEAALLADDGGGIIVRLSRAGWRNPAELPRGTLQRVQYRIEDRTLLREYWPVMDHPLGMEPRSQALLEGVEELRIEYLDDEGQWQEQWPPLNQLDIAGAPGPRAARLTLVLDGWGEISRLVEMTP